MSGGSATVTVWTCRSNYCTDRYTTFYSYAWSNQVVAPTVVACAEGTISYGKYSGHNAACV